MKDDQIIREKYSIELPTSQDVQVQRWEEVLMSHVDSENKLIKYSRWIRVACRDNLTLSVIQLKMKVFEPVIILENYLTESTEDEHMPIF